MLRVQRACSGTSSDAAPPDRATRTAAPTILPPAERTASIASCTEPPVVMMSSTTSRKWPARRASDARKMRSPSAGVIGIATYSARMRALTVIPKKPGSAEVREVPDPVPADDEVVVDVVRVGLCGTDAEIDHGEYGVAPPGSDFLILGHESFGRVSRPARPTKESGPVLAESTPVVASG